jgi:hypothetical protein
MILAVNGQPIDGMESFNSLINALAPGRRVSLTALDHRTGNMGDIFVTAR